MVRRLPFERDSDRSHRLDRTRSAAAESVTSLGDPDPYEPYGRAGHPGGPQPSPV